MATDIRISELNQITSNNDLNQLIINERENAGDVGITKKIQISNLLTPNIVKTNNITDCAVVTNKINDKAVTAGKIADNTITSSQITCRCITNDSLATNSVDNRVIKNSDNYTLNCVTAATNVTTPLATVTSKLTVGAIGGGKTVSLNGISYDFPPTEVPNYFLKTDGSGNLAWAEAVPGDGTSLVFSEISPVGTIISWAGDALPADGKWLECNGTTFDGTDFPELSAVLLDTWGTHSGVNYYLPDLKGRAAVGTGTGNDGTDSCAFTLGGIGGKYNHKLTYPQMPAHKHVSPFGEANLDICWRWGTYQTNVPGCGSNGGRDNDNKRYGFTTYAGGASVENGISTCISTTAPHNNIQPYAVTRYIIKALPDDIQQFNMDVGPGLSALNASGGQTAKINLSSTEIGLKVTDDFQFDGSGRLTLNDNVSASSITFDDGTVQTTAVVIGRKRVSSTTDLTVTGVIPLDNTTPLITEGDEILTTVYTPRSTNNKLVVEFNGFLMHSDALTGLVIALFEGNTCVGARWWTQASSGAPFCTFTFEFTPSSTGNNTYSLRYGTGATGLRVAYVNRQSNAAGTLGGFQEYSMTIQEVTS